VQVALDKKGCNFNSFCVATSAALMNTVGGIISRSVEQVSKPSWFQVLFLYCCFLSCLYYNIGIPTAEEEHRAMFIQGAATTCYVAMHPQVQGITGGYFGNCNIAKPSSQGVDAELAKELWKFSLQIVSS
jgi:hypothetical protein